MSDLLIAIVLGVHLFAAVLFVGGSFFMWLVVDPASYDVTRDESARTALVGRMARRFGSWSTGLLLLLIVTGLYNASWYLGSTSDLLTTIGGQLLLAKVVTVAILVALVYAHGLYFGRRIMRLAREGRMDELRLVRRVSRKVSYINLGLMLVVLALAVALQVWG